ncbi:MAG: hypothetical protein RR495_07620, partial [Anaerovoracaceae bacterium]
PGNNTNVVVERPAPAPVTTAPTPTPAPTPSPAPVTPKPTPACDPNAYLSDEYANIVATVGIWKTNKEAYDAGIKMWNDGSVEYGKGFTAIAVFNSCQDVVGYTIYWVK